MPLPSVPELQSRPSSINTTKPSTSSLNHATHAHETIAMAPHPDVKTAIAEAEKAAVDGDGASYYESIVAHIVKDPKSPSTAADDLNAVADSFFGLNLGVVTVRSVLGAFIAAMKSLGDDDVCIHFGDRLLATVAAQPSSFHDAAAAICELIATAHENNNDFVDAAKVLARINLDGGQRKLSPDDTAAVWIRIVRNYLEAGDHTAAGSYVSKLKLLMYSVEAEELRLHFRLSEARIHDAHRQFASASQKYHEISFASAIADEERLHTLGMAIKCGILAPAGPERKRILGRLYVDERAAQLDEFGILEKMFLDRLLSAAEVDKFATGLQPHQLAITSDGSTVLAKAVVEHNLLAASKLYVNIRFEALGSLLGLDADRAEETTARMIEQGRLVGRMDQLDGIVWFEGGEASGVKGSGRAEAIAGKEMRRWDANVQSLAEEVENITSSLQREFPEFVAANLLLV